MSDVIDLFTKEKLSGSTSDREDFVATMMKNAAPVVYRLQDVLTEMNVHPVVAYIAASTIKIQAGELLLAEDEDLMSIFMDLADEAERKTTGRKPCV